MKDNSVYSTIAFPIVFLALLLFTFRLSAQQTASLYVGGSQIFAAPNPPIAGAAISQAKYGSRHKAVSVQPYMTTGCKATVTEYFEDRAEIICEYSYYYYVNGRQIGPAHATTYYYVTCKAVECRLKTYNMTLSPGESQLLQYTLSPNITPTPTVRFFSNNTLVAEVWNNGTVKAKSPGRCTITVSSSAGPDAECQVYVRSLDPTDVYLSSPNPIKINQTIQIVPSLIPSNASTTFTWSSNKTSVASVDSYGNVTGKSEGTARITVTTANGLSASCDVEVYKPVPSQIRLNKTSLSMAVGTSETLAYDVSPSDAIYSVTWESSDNDVAAVGNNGRVEAKATGMARITATTDNGKSSTCQVTVEPEPTGITISPQELELIMGREKKLSYTFTPSNALTRSLTWCSSNNNVASIDQNGLVKAIRPGNAILSATTANGLTEECNLTVPEPLFQMFLWTKNGIKTGYLSTDEPEFQLEGKTIHFSTKMLSLDIPKEEFDKFTLEQVLPEHPQGISLPEDVKLGLGQIQKLVYTLSPTDAETKVTWFNDNPDVVSITDGGQMTGLQVGTAQIMAQTSNGLRAESIVTVPEPHYNFYVWLRNGIVHGFELEEKPQVYLGEEVFKLTTGNTKLSYQAKDVLRFTLQDAAVEDIPTDILQPKTMESEARYQSGRLTIQGERPFTLVRIYDVSGRLVKSLQSNEKGCLDISLSSYPAGIYIINIEQITIKIQKR